MSKEEQKELLALLPQGVEVISQLTKSQKLILAQIILMYGTDYAAENQHIYRTNETLMNDTGIKSEKTIITSVRVLEDMGLIARVSGKRKFASTYQLTDYYFEVTGRKRPELKGCNYGCNFENKGENIDIMGILEEMQQRISDLEQQVAELKGCNYGCNYGCNFENYSENYSTETESEIESESELESHECSCTVPVQTNEITSDEIREAFDDVDREEQEREQEAFLKNPYPSNNFKERNDWATSRIERLKSTIEVYKKCWTQPSVGNYENDIRATFNAIDEKVNQGWFTDKQINYFNSFRNNFDALVDGKHKRMKLNEQNATKESITSDIKSESEDEGGRGALLPKLYTKEMLEELCEGWTMEKLVNNGMASTIDKWQTELEQKTNSPICYQDFMNDVFEVIAHEPMVAYA